MIIGQQEFNVKGLTYSIRSAKENDAGVLSSLRVQMDGETENMDREQGEGFIDTSGFEQIIRMDRQKKRNLFLVAVVKGAIVGYSRCEGSDLRRFSHKVEFGVCVANKYWGYGIGKQLLRLSIDWADANGIEKMILNVVETNDRAIEIYQKVGFEIEGTLKNDRRHANGRYYDTVIMGRFREEGEKRE